MLLCQNKVQKLREGLTTNTSSLLPRELSFSADRSCRGDIRALQNLIPSITANKIKKRPSLVSLI